MPLWLVGPSHRLREISNIITYAPYSAEYAASIAEDAAAFSILAAQFSRCSNAYTSPILRLSPELIHEIIAYVAELEPTRPQHAGMDSYWERQPYLSLGAADHA